VAINTWRRAMQPMDWKIIDGNRDADDCFRHG
jgi:hypothetical protein